MALQRLGYEHRKLNLARARLNPNENWMLKKLREQTPYKWSRQVLWGYRIFDFWCDKLGFAVEVDGPEHRAWSQMKTRAIHRTQEPGVPRGVFVEAPDLVLHERGMRIVYRASDGASVRSP